MTEFIDDISIIIYSLTLVYLCVSERVMYTILVLFSHRYSAAKRVEAKHVVSGQIDFLSQVFVSSVSYVVRVLFYLMSWWLLFVVISVFLGSVYILYEDDTSFFIAAVNFYNLNIGPILSQLILVPLYMVGMLFRAIIPLWNAVTWFIRMWVEQGFLPIIMQNVDSLILSVNALSSMFQELANAWTFAVQTTSCVGANCLVPGSHTLNLITPMGYFKQAAAYATVIFRQFCSYTAAPVEILTYPLLDYNLALFVHNLGNSLFTFGFAIPTDTLARCSLAVNDTFHVMMCTPDVAPGFNFLVASFSSLGSLIDNWINVALAIVEVFFTGSTVACSSESGPTIANIMTTDTIFPGSSWDASHIRVVGLTDSMYALTDGKRIVYKGQLDAVSKLGTWPTSITSQYGIAAVTLHDVAPIDVNVVTGGSTINAMETTTMLGCNCLDDATQGVIITCTLVPVEGWVTSDIPSLTTSIVFPDSITQQSLKCGWIDILVKSIRFSFYRYSNADVNYDSTTTTSLPQNDCISRGNCREADASIWIIPRCGQDVNTGVIAACVPGSSCFPYCMGLRLAGSGNNNIVLASAASWKQGRTVLNQDCSIHNSTPSTVSSISNALVSSYVQDIGNILGSSISTTVFASPQSGTKYRTANIPPSCYPASKVVSRVSNAFYVASVYNTYSAMQPFVVTGDTIFTSKDLGGGVSAVVIDRLVGDQQNQFSMAALNQDFPAVPPLNTPSAENTYTDTGRILIPYATRITGSVATHTRNYVIYASNPDYGVFSAYFDYCSRDPTLMPKFGLIITSSYGPIRLYRVSAYVKCQTYSCGSNLVQHVDLDEFAINYDKQCNTSFNVSVSGLEYLNEDNVAVIITAAALKNWQSSTLTFLNTTTQVLWLNPATMQLSNNIWQPNAANLSIGELCPAMQRLPRLGTLFAEIAISGVYVLKYMVQIPLYLPGLIFIWHDGGQCPQQTYGHSMLIDCGNTILSLDDFFDSLDDAGVVFWHSLNKISYLLQITGMPAQSPISDILDGMAYYGEGSIDVLSVSSAAITMAQVPISNEISTIVASVQTGAVFSSVGIFHGNSMLWARYIYSIVSNLVLIVVKTVLQTGGATSAQMWIDFWNILFSFQTYYQSTVQHGNNLMCSGINTILGVDSPVAEMMYYVCMANGNLFASFLNGVVNITTYVPMVVCVCKNANGYNTEDYVVNTCSQQLPLQIRPQLYIIAMYIMQQAYDPTGIGLCEAVISYSKDQIIHAMDPYFTNMNLALSSMSDALDYMLIILDSGAGKCADFQGDPHVVAIVPQPVDYFQMCGKTGSCKTKCSAEWMLFQQYNTTPLNMPSVNVQYQSMFFPSQYDSTLSVENVTAILEVGSATMNPAGQYLCIQKTYNPDFVILTLEAILLTLQIRVWCVPQSPLSTVYVGLDTQFQSVTLNGDLVESMFLNSQLVYVLVRVNEVNLLYSWEPMGVYTLVPYVPIPAHTLPINIINIWPLMNTVYLDVMMEQTANDLVQIIVKSVMYHYFWSPTLKTWVQSTDPDISTFAQSHMITCVDPVNFVYFLVPRLSFLPGYTLKINFIDPLPPTALLTVVTSFDPNSMAMSLSGGFISPRTLTGSYAFVVIPVSWDWLRKLDLTFNNLNPTSYTITQVARSASVVMSLQTTGRCDETSCEGCQSLLVQRLCQAYNKCALVRCVGTLVNQMRPLCNIGQTLSFKGSQTLDTMLSAWTIVAEIIATTMELVYVSSKKVDISWPDELFTSSICTAKDFSTEFWAIATSIINKVLHMYNSNPAQVFKGGARLDTNTDAALTIQSTALNMFLSQITLYPIYLMIALKQVYTCQVNGALALLDVTGYSITVQNADFSNGTASVAGQCLALSANIALQNFFVSNTTPSFVANTANFVSNIQSFVLLQTADYYVHFLDAALTYAIGIIHTFAILLMALFPDKCNPPDFFLPQTIECACNDQPLSIPDSIATQGIADYALWCSGTLGMIDNTNTPVVVVNPYTYRELQLKSASFQAYIQCASQSYNCPNEPSDPLFIRQGVNVLNVLTKCRENFIKKQWDPYAYVYFDKSSSNLVQNYGGYIPSITSDTATCLVQSHKNGMGPGGCMDAYLSTLPMQTPDVYWAMNLMDTSQGLQYQDACLVFTGPALVQQRPLFQNCVDQTYTLMNSLCTLNPQIWSVQSSNDVAVADPHIIMYDGQTQMDIVKQAYQDAHDIVMKAILNAIYQWTNNSNQAVQLDFFSTEGDAIHQILDCIYMGPYAKIDYWPVPAIIASTETISAPAWHRYEPGTTPTRSIDINTCPSTTTMPFSCGSQARRSLIHYFVKTVLSGNRKNGNSNQTLMQKVILAELRQLYDTWNNMSQYACQCSGSSTGFAPSCCTTNSSTWLPNHLAQPFQDINASSVLDALDEEYEYMYNFSMQNPLPWIDINEDFFAGKYDWLSSQQAQQEGYLDPTKPAYDYTNMLNISAGGAGLWGICHSSLKQVFFTVPVRESQLVDFEAVSAYNGDPALLESTIKAMSQSALANSPLYRHYYTRYHPTQSLMCSATASSVPTMTESSSTYADFVQAGQTLVTSADIFGSSLNIPTLNYDMLAVGNQSCFCGWPLLSTGYCSVPTIQSSCTTVCAIPNLCTSSCLYPYAYDGMVAQSVSTSTVFCPQQQFSMHWGIGDETDYEAWMSGTNQLSLSLRSLYQYGRGGLRAGNVADIVSNPSNYIAESQRSISLQRGQIPSCTYASQLQSISETAAVQLAEQLFPISHGVDESGVASFCLRYFIEKARYNVLDMISIDFPNTLNLTLEVIAQNNLMVSWGKKCGAQLYLLHLCVSLDVFHPAVIDNLHQIKCAYFTTENSPSFYSTPDCLVYLDGEFYDPCRCMPCQASYANNLYQPVQLDPNAIKATPSCKLRFNPINKATNLNAPIGLWEDEPAITNYLDFLNLTLLQMLLDDPDAVGNTPYSASQGWQHTEGYMDENNAEFCDMMVDYWDDNQSYPVGYHVSTTCEAADNAYRTFMTAFSQQTAVDSGGNTVPVLVYENDLMRDIQYIDTNFGVNGLCRQTNFGMDMTNINTMVFCTQNVQNEVADYTMAPMSPTVPPEYSSESCTSDSSQLPWDSYVAGQVYSSAAVSLGTIPHMPPSSASAYPVSIDPSNFFDVGPDNLMTPTWNAQCPNYPMFHCSDKVQCGGSYVCRARRCSGSTAYKACNNDSDCGTVYDICQGVCVHEQVECINHMDCLDPRFMCTGDGACVQPEIIVENRDPLFNISVQFQVQTNDNTNMSSLGDTYSLNGGSYWGYMGTDLLNLHGMCSYTNWYKYNQYYLPTCDKTRSTANVCWIDPTKTQYVDLSTPNGNASGYWWDALHPQRPFMMSMRPTNCDRDYERLYNFTFFQPRLSDVVYVGMGSVVMSSPASVDAYDKFTRAYESATISQIPMAILDNSSRPQRFLYGPVLDGQISPTVQNPFQPCGNVRQCLASPFTRNFQSATRLIRDLSFRKYEDQDTFICGSIGYLNAARQCVIDGSVFPLYEIFCLGMANYARCMRNSLVLETTRNDMCSSILSPYPAQYAVIQQNTQALQQLHYLFQKTIVNFTDVMYITDCALDVYAYMSSQPNTSKTMYYPLTFVIKEIPFDFFYQCFMLQPGYTIQNTFLSDQTCSTYKQKASNMFPGPTAGATPLVNFLRIIRGGFSYDQYVLFQEVMHSLGMQLIQNISLIFIEKYPGGVDQSVPICTQYRQWKDNLGAVKDFLVDNYYTSSTCQKNRFSQLFDIINANFIETQYRNVYDLNESLYFMSNFLSTITYQVDFTQYTTNIPYSYTTWQILLSEPYVDPLTIDTWRLAQDVIPSQTLLKTIWSDLSNYWGLAQLPASSSDTPYSNQYSVNALGSQSASLTENYMFGYLFNMPEIVVSSTQNTGPGAGYPFVLEQGLIPSTPTIGQTFTDPPGNPAPRRCAFKQSDDPALTTGETCIYNNVTNLRSCGPSNTVCSSIPIISHQARFFCHYHYLQFDSNVNIQDAYQVYTYLYNYIRSNFMVEYRSLGLQNMRLRLKTLPFFVDTDWQLNWGFNLSSELDYISNNQPDTSKPVMCSISTETPINYNKCNHPYWEKLKQHVETYYYHDGALIVPAHTQIQWKVTRDMFTKGFISSYSSSNKSASTLEKYLDKLFSESSVCQMSIPYATQEYQQKVCYHFVDSLNNIQANVINPWLHGYYNPYVECDVQFTGVTPDSSEYIDTYIYAADGSIVYPPNMPGGDTCLAKRNQIVQSPGPSRFPLDPTQVDGNFNYNLCQHQIADGFQCDHDQGILGGDDGLPVGAPTNTYNMFMGTQYVDAYNQYTAAANMYSTSFWNIPQDFYGSPYNGSNPLWAGKDSQTGFLKVNDYDIGVYKIGLSLDPFVNPDSTDSTAHTFRVKYLPLSDEPMYTNVLLSERSDDNTSVWVAVLQTSLNTDSQVNTRYETNIMSAPDSTLASALCPLLRFAYYGRNKTRQHFFHPVTPSPRRSRYMFQRINNDRYVHPTVTHDYTARNIGKYMTVNGVCFCPLLQGQPIGACMSSIFESQSGACSLQATLKLVAGTSGLWTVSQVIPVQDTSGNSKPCTVPLDWPVINTTMRDGSVSSRYTSMWSQASDPQSQQCHILDRFQSFNMRYKNTKTPKKSGKNTVTDGVCKTGRVSVKAGVSTTPGVRCVKNSQTSTQTQHVCDGSSSTFTLPRPQAVPASYLYQKYKLTRRNKCSVCAPPPAFQRNSRIGYIKNETSFGRAFRLSATRQLAKDLRSVFQAANIEYVINDTAWSSSGFLQNYLLNPQYLVKSSFWPSNYTVSTPNVSSWKVDDSSKWDTPWVYCPTVDSFKTKQCVGSISRQDWITTKTTMCPQVVKYYMQGSNQDPMSHASFANIDQYTNAVANAIIQAREIIINANCMASGNVFCLPQPYVYNPSSYDSTNRAWVHDTVTQYYQSVDTYACPTNMQEATFLQYLKQNQVACPANNMYVFEAVLSILRTSVGQVSLLVQQFFSLSIKLIASIFDNTELNSVKQQWAVIKSSFSSLLGTISDMGVNALMNSGTLGQDLMRFIQTSCKWINDFLIWMADVYCKYVFEHLIDLLGYITRVVNFVDTHAKAVQEFIKFLLKYYLPLSFLKRYLQNSVYQYMIDKFSGPSDKTARAIDAQTAELKANTAALTAQTEALNAQTAAMKGTSAVSAATEVSVGAVTQTEAKLVQPAPISRLTKITTSVSGALSKVSQVLGEIPMKGTLLATIGLFGISSIFDSLISAQEDKIKQTVVGQMWVSNMNAFNFQLVYDALDNATYFLSNDQTCAHYLFMRQYGTLDTIVKCPAFQWDPVNTENPSKAIDATMCWATAAPALGDSSMYSCTASSTCCPSSGCSSDKTLNVLCNECPAPTTGISKYACDNMQCKCSVPVQITSYCSSNGVCDPTAYCDLISMMSSVSFGTLQCGLCPGKLMCIASTTSSISGRCGCVMDKTVDIATCFETPGTTVYPDPTMLCGYTPVAQTSLSRYSFQYTDLMYILCSKSLNSVCATVYMDNGNVVNMPVSTQIRSSSGSGRRRNLLSVDDHEVYDWQNVSNDDLNEAFFLQGSVFRAETDFESMSIHRMHEILHMPGWNATAAPCSNLVHAYQNGHFLGVIDNHELQKCAYWRYIAMILIKRHNLTSLVDLDTFLVSIEDFSASLLHKNVLWNLLSEPGVFMQVLALQPIFKPLRALGVFFSRLVVNMVKSLPHTYNSSSTELNIKKDEDIFFQLVKAMHNIDYDYTFNASKRPLDHNLTGTLPVNKTRKLEKIRQNIAKKHKNTTAKARKTRKLLATTSEIQAIQQYSASVASGQIQPPLSIQATQSWLKGPYSWPPMYMYSISTCPIILVTKNVFVEVFSVVSLYYQHVNDPRPPRPKTLRANAFAAFSQSYKNPLSASTTASAGSAYLNRTSSSSGSWASSVVYYLMGVIHVSTQDLKYFLFAKGQWSLAWIIEGFWTCNFNDVMACGSDVKDLLMSTAWFGIFYAIFSFLCSSAGFPSLSYIMLVNYPAFILWYAYGMSPICLPMLPPCFFDDVVSTLQSLVPVTISLPQGLYCNPSDASLIFPNKTICLKPCSDLGFTQWYDPPIYFACSLDLIWCKQVVDWVPITFNLTVLNTTFHGYSILDPWVVALHSWYNVTAQNQNNLSAYTFCMLIEAFKALPFVFFLVTVLSTLSVLLLTILGIVPAFISIITRIVMFNHTK